jgi:hypothetical protein
METSYGVPKQILEHPVLKLGAGLPLCLAFYLANAPHQISFAGFELGELPSALLQGLGVVVYYAAAFAFLILAMHLSRIVQFSRLHYAWPILTLAAAVLLATSNEGSPAFCAIFGAPAFMYLIFARKDKGTLSNGLVALTGLLLALSLLVVGTLWAFKIFRFSDAISFLFGLGEIAPNTVALGAAALTSLAGSIFYAIVTSETMK